MICLSQTGKIWAMTERGEPQTVFYLYITSHFSIYFNVFSVYIFQCILTDRFRGLIYETSVKKSNFPKMVKFVINFYYTRTFTQNWFYRKYLLLLVFLRWVSESFLVLLYHFSLLNHIVSPMKLPSGVKIAQIRMMEKTLLWHFLICRTGYVLNRFLKACSLRS